MCDSAVQSCEVALDSSERLIAEQARQLEDAVRPADSDWLLWITVGALVGVVGGSQL